MTILSEVNRIKGNVSDAYDILETKGATMPVSEDTDSLARTVATIETITIDSELSSTSTNPVQNKVINTALSNKLDINASNLSSTGQKVFDGQWVRIYEVIASGFQVSNNTSDTWKYEAPITSFSWLPNDNYTYEINLGYWLSCTGTGNGTKAFCLVSHFNETINDYLPQAFVYNISGTKYNIPATGTTRILMGSTRSIRLISFIGTVGVIDLVATAYRRIGTNS